LLHICDQQTSREIGFRQPEKCAFIEWKGTCRRSLCAFDLDSKHIEPARRIPKADEKIETDVFRGSTEDLGLEVLQKELR
jgi:hypothetical protein